MDWGYIVGQIFVIINYAFLITTYQLKNRNLILILNFIAVVATLISYIFLSAYTGVAMSVVAIIRSLMFMNSEKKKKSDNITKEDVINLIILYVMSIVLAIFTYDGIFSLLVVFITMIYTFSIWQKSTKVYKILGLPVGVLGIMYNIYIFSVFGIVFESLLTIFAFVGFFRELKNN